MALTPIDQSPKSDLLSMIADKAEQHGVDPGLMQALAQTESGLDPKAISPTRATGLFQFTRATAKQYGLQNRLDPEASADAAARYMRDLLDQTNNDPAEALRRYKGVRAGGAPERSVGDTLTLAKHKYGANVDTPEAPDVPRGTSSVPQPSLPDLVNMSDEDFNAWLANATKPEAVSRPAIPPAATEAPAPEASPINLFQGVTTRSSNQRVGQTATALKKQAIPAWIKVSEPSGEGVVGQPLPNAKPTNIPDAAPETPTIGAGGGTDLGTEAGRVLKAIAQGPLVALEKVTGVPLGVTKEGSLDADEQQKLKDMGLPTEPVPGYVDAQKQAVWLNPDSPQDAAQLDRLKQSINRAAGNVAEAEKVGGPNAREEMRASGTEPQTGTGQAIASAGQRASEFLTEAAIAKFAKVPEITGLNVFGSAALVGAARPVASGEETPFQAATEVGGGELLGNTLKIPEAATRMAAGAGLTGGEAVLQTAASGRPLDAKDIASQAAQGALMTMAGEHAPEEPAAQPFEPKPHEPAINPDLEPNVQTPQAPKPEAPQPKVGEQIQVARKLPVTVEAPKGTEVELERGYKPPAPGEPEKAIPAETRTLTHTVGTIESVGQTADHPITALVGDEKTGRKVFVADLYEDGKFVGHNVIAQVDDPQKAVAMLRENYGDDVANNAVLHETTQHPVRTWMEQGDLTKPFADQTDDIREKAGATSSFVRVDKVDNAGFEEPKANPDEKFVKNEPKGEENAAVTGDEQRRDFEEHRGDDEVVGGNGEDRQSADQRPEESPRGSGGSGSPQGEGQPEIIGPRKSLVDEQRERLGMKPIEPDLPEHVRDWMQSADAADRNDRNAGSDLVTELTKKSRPVTREEAGLLAIELTRRTTERDAAAHDSAVAASSGDATLAAQKAAMFQAKDAGLEDIHQVLRKAGSHASDVMNVYRTISEKLDDGRYTLPRIEEELVASRGGKPLDDAGKEKAKSVWQNIENARQEFESARSGASDAEALAHIQSLAREMAKEAKSAKAGGKSFVDYMGDRRAKALARIAQRKKEEGLHAYAVIDPRAIRDYAEIGAYHIAKGLRDFAEWSKAFLKDLGEKPKAKLEDIFRASQDLHDAHEALYGGKEGRAPKTREDVLKQAGAMAEAGEKPTGSMIENLARHHLEQGVPFDKVMSHVTSDLQSAMPGVTERQVRDLWTGYGKARFPSKDELDKQVRELRAASLLKTKIEVAESGKPPMKTGGVRDKATQRIRDLNKELRRVMREHNITAAPTERQLASDLDRIKTGLRNAIEDIERFLKTGEEKARALPPEYDAEAKALKTHLDELREQKRQVDEASGKTLEQRQNLAMHSAERLASIYDDAVQRGQQLAKSAPTPENDAMREARAHREEAHARYKEIFDTDNQQRLKAIDKRLQDVQKKIQDKDFAEPNKKVVAEQSARVVNKAVEYERAKKEFNAQREQYRIEQLQGWKKFEYNFWRVRRGLLLTAASAIEKIGSYAVMDGLIGSAIDEAASGVMSKLPILSHVSKQAQFEGGASIKAEAKALAGFWQGMVRDSWTHLKNQRTPFQLEFEIKKGIAKPDWIDYPGAMHSALKDPVVMSHFARMMEKGYEWSLTRGENLDPATEDGLLRNMQIRNQAALLAIDKKLMGDNKVVSIYNMLVNQLSGGATLGERVISRFATAENPIIKVPTNWAFTMMRREFGWAAGGSEILWKGLKPATQTFFASKGNFVAASRAFVHALDEMPPERADIVMKRLKQGWGGGITLAAFFVPEMVHYFGGYAVHGERRDPDDLTPLEIRGLPKQLGRALSHTGIAAQIQLGVTIRRQLDGMFADDMIAGKPHGIDYAVWAGILGQIQDVPLLSLMRDISKIGQEPSAAGDVAMGFGQSLVTPGLLQNVAQWTDPNVQRKPDGIVDRLKMGIPGLRQQVPQKPQDVTGQILSAMRKGDAAAVSQLVEKSNLDDKKLRKIEKSAALPPLVYHFKKIKDLKQAAQTYEHAPPEKKAALKGYFIKKIQKDKTLPPSEKSDLVREALPELR